MMTPRRMAADLERQMNGPHSEEHTVQAAFLVAETVRFLNYATGTHAADGLPWPGTAYDVTGCLKVAAQRLPQCLDQLSNQMKRDLNDGLIATADRQEDTLKEAVTAFDGHLATAALLAGQLAVALSDAQSAITDVNGRGTNRPGVA